MAHEEARTVTYPASGWILLALPFVMMIALMSFQAVTVEKQRQLQVKADRKLQALNARALPVLESVRPLVGRIGSADLDEVRKAGREAAQLIRGLERAGAPEAISAAGELARQLTSRNADDALVEAGLLARDLRAAGLPELAGHLNRNGRFVGMIERADRFLSGTEAFETLDDVDRGADAAVDNRRIARDTLQVQKEALRLLKQTLVVQTEALQRLRSIDERTGGAVTPP